MKYAITGSTGFLGVHLIHHLLQLGHEVVALKRSTSSLLNFNLSKKYYGYNEDIYHRLEWRDLQLEDTEALARVFSKATHVIHAAALISYNSSDFDKLIHTNHKLTSHVVNACIASKVGTLIYISSTGAIAKPTNNDINESASWDSNLDHTRYGYTKQLGEIEVERAKLAGINTVILNPGVILGYGNWNNGSLKLFKNAYKSFPFYSMGSTGFIGVEDICKVVAHMSNINPCNERFILISENRSFKSISNLMSEGFHKRKAFIEVKGFLYHIVYAVISVKDRLGIKGMLTKESTRAAVIKHSFDSSKIKSRIPFELTPIEDVIKKSCKAYNNKRPN